MFIYLHVCVHLCTCVLCPSQCSYHLPTHLLPMKIETPLFSCLLIKARSSHSCRFSLPACLPLPRLAGLARVQLPPLTLYHCVVQAIRPSWYHTIPEWKIHVSYWMDIQVLLDLEGLLRIRKDDNC